MVLQARAAWTQTVRLGDGQASFSPFCFGKQVFSRRSASDNRPRLLSGGGEGVLSTRPFLRLADSERERVASANGTRGWGEAGHGFLAYPPVTSGPRGHTLETTQAWGPTQRLSLRVSLSVCTGVSWVLMTEELGGAHETYSEVFI